MRILSSKWLNYVFCLLLFDKSFVVKSNSLFHKTQQAFAWFASCLFSSIDFICHLFSSLLPILLLYHPCYISLYSILLIDTIIVTLNHGFKELIVLNGVWDDNQCHYHVMW